jgi:hypothetical protein
MPRKVARSDPGPPCGLPDVLVAVRTSGLSCRKAGKAPIFTPVREPSGESRLRALIVPPGAAGMSRAGRAAQAYCPLCVGLHLLLA